MSTNEQTDVVVSGYNKRPSPTTDQAIKLYLSLELQAIEKTLKSLEESAIQVIDAEPASPKKGMVRFNVAPWNPLGNGSQGLVLYNGNAWVAV
jgi:hypothetical protein